MKICHTCSATYSSQTGFCPKDGSLLAEFEEWTSNTVVRGKYRILGAVGRGGMASVYKALHLGFNEMRALKVLNRELATDTRFVQRFKQEASVTRKLQHPNVVRVEDIDETEEGQPFIVMEFIEGESLRSLMEGHGAVQARHVCAIAKQIASALSFAHRHGVVHRDIKPDNIVLVVSSQASASNRDPMPGLIPNLPAAQPLVKVLDFGIAMLKEARAGDTSGGSALTQPGVIIGTPEYMSPEQAKGSRGDDLDGRSDIYSLGILMYRMLTGTLPFKATTTIEMLLAHLQVVPTPIPTLRPDLQIPRPLADIVMQCLEKSREARPQTAQAVIEALERAEGATPPSFLATDRAAELKTATPDLPLSREGSASTVHTQKIEPVVEQAPAQGLKALSATVMIPGPDIKGIPDFQPATAPAFQDQIPVESTSRSGPPGKPDIRKGWTSYRRAWTLALALVVLATVPIWYVKSHPAAPKAGDRTPPVQAVSPVPQSEPMQKEGNVVNESGANTRVHPAEPSRGTNKEGIEHWETEGDSFGARDDYDDAIGAYQHALRLDPTNARLKDKISRMQRSSEVIKRQKQVRGAETEGDLLRERGEYDQAIDAYQAGLKVDPANASLLNKIADARRAKSSKKQLNH